MLAQESKPNAVADCDDAAFRDHLLAAMRAGSLRLLLAKAELDSIGTALKGGFIGTDEAVRWMAEVGAMPLIDAVLGGPDEQ